MVIPSNPPHRRRGYVGKKPPRCFGKPFSRNGQFLRNAVRNLLSTLRVQIVCEMVVGVLKTVLSIPGSDSLKDKRQVVKSILDIARNRFNVSAAEIDQLESHRRAGLGFACVSNDKALANKILDRVLDHIESDPRCEVVESELDFV